MKSDDPDAHHSESELAGEAAVSEADEWWVDRFILYAVRESMLWALLLVVLAHVAAFIATALLAAIRTGHPLGISISLLLVGGTAASVRAEVRRKGRPAGLSWLLLATWSLSGVIGWAGHRLELL